MPRPAAKRGFLDRIAMRRTFEVSCAMLFLLLLLGGCRLKRPDGILSPKKMEAVLYDYHLAQAVVMELPREERYARDAYMDWCFEKNGITKEEFDNSLVWYTRYPKELADIYQRLSERLDKEYDKASKALLLMERNTSFQVSSGDSVDLWYLNRVNIMNTSVYMKRLTFSIPTDTTFHNSDTLVWNIAHTFVAPFDSIPQSAYLELSVYYNDSVSATDTLLFCTGKTILSLATDSSNTITRISGSVNYMDPSDNRSSMLVLSDLSLLRYHRRETLSDVAPAELGTDDGSGGGDVE